MDNFYKTILSEISIPVCVFDSQAEMIFYNEKFSTLLKQKNINAKTLDEINQAFIDENLFLNTQKIDAEGNVFYICTCESSLNQAHLDFVSTVSHELRTPLTSIKGFADTMLHSSDALTKEQREKFLTIIINQTKRLTRLIENLLAITNLSSKRQKMILKAINFQEFISTLILSVEKKYPNRTFSSEIQYNLPDIWADSDMLEQIMLNLLDNAAKYSYPDSKIEIKAAFKNNCILIEIIDEGVEIPQDCLEKIFNKFSRIDNPLTRQVEGSGLGLFITKNLVENLNGKITAQSVGNKTIISIELPSINFETQMESKITGEK
ncbi:MAG: ATP-binding protein [Candidatus Gastranaerophilales bacterium]|nr:ATP-binding protein [Candidatus Gastranaerophilales bacterium]